MLQMIIFVPDFLYVWISLIRIWTDVLHSCTEDFSSSDSVLPCWLLLHWSPGQQGHWSPALTGSGYRSEATPLQPCKSGTHLEKSVSAGLQIIHSGRTSAAERPSPTPRLDSRSCKAPAPPAWMCWTPCASCPRRWVRRWSSCAARTTPWCGKLQSGKPGPPCSCAPVFVCRGRRPAGRCSSPRPGLRPPVDHSLVR